MKLSKFDNYYIEIRARYNPRNAKTIYESSIVCDCWHASATDEEVVAEVIRELKEIKNIAIKPSDIIFANSGRSNEVVSINFPTTAGKALFAFHLPINTVIKNFCRDDCKIYFCYENQLDQWLGDTRVDQEILFKIQDVIRQKHMVETLGRTTTAPDIQLRYSIA